MHFIALPIHFLGALGPVTDQKGLDLAEMSIQCNGVGVPGAINVVELCARCNKGLNMMSGEDSVRCVALPLEFGGT